MKEAQLRKVKEQIQASDASHGNKSNDTHQLDENFKETNRRITESKTSKKVYEHMLARIQKEQAILKQKMLKMEEHISRKRRELNQRVSEGERISKEKVQSMEVLESLERD